MYGHRARIGYCSPPYVTETFCYEFYKMVPEGVTLLIKTLEVRTRAAAEIARVLAPGGRLVLVDEDFADPDHPDYETWGSKHHAADDGHEDDDQEDDGHEDDGHSHGFQMVDATRMGDLLTAAGVTDVEAGKRTLAGRPVIAVTAG